MGHKACTCFPIHPAPSDTTQSRTVSSGITPRFLDLWERLPEWLLCLYLMPAQEMHDPVVSKEVEAQREHSVILTAHR